MKYSGVGVIIENKNQEILLHLRDGNTSRMPHQWCLVGGMIEEGESLIGAATREVKEETNLTLSHQKHIKDFSYEGKNIALVTGFVDSEKENLIKGEGAAFRFIPKKEVVEFVKSLEYTNPYIEELCLFSK